MADTCSRSHEDIRHMSNTASLAELMKEAARLRNEGHSIVTFSPKVFLPLTRLCRNECGYCTFATPPAAGRRAYMTLEEILSIARAGAAQGCTEALFTLGDKPEDIYPKAAEELAALGHDSTVSYVAAAAGAVFAETGLLPHVNAGILDLRQLTDLRRCSASQGLMLETTSERLLQPGMAHHNCPDKVPAARLATIEAAGRAQVPFTTGVLIGIGETREERLDALFAIRDLHARYGHIQEVIIQNFRAKKGTAMAAAPEPLLEDLLWTVAMARIIMGPRANVQAPPNLTPIEQGADASGSLEASWAALLAAGINDWGGLSPLTRDFVNPEKPWPHIAGLAAVTARAGFALLPRLTVYPEYMVDSAAWLSDAGGRGSVLAGALRSADSAGLARGSPWCPGSSVGERYFGGALTAGAIGAGTVGAAAAGDADAGAPAAADTGSEPADEAAPAASAGAAADGPGVPPSGAGGAQGGNVGAKFAGIAALDVAGSGASTSANAASTVTGSPDASSGAIGGCRAGAPEVPPGADAIPPAGAAIPQVTDVAAGEVEEATAGGSPLDAGKALAAQAEVGRDTTADAAEPQRAVHSGSSSSTGADASSSNASSAAGGDGAAGGGAVPKFAGNTALNGEGSSSGGGAASPATESARGGSSSPEASSSDASSGAIGGSRAGTQEMPPGDAATPAAGMAVPQVTDVAAGEVEQATAGDSPLDAGKALAAQADDGRDASAGAEAPQDAAALDSGSSAASSGAPAGDVGAKFAGIAALGIGGDNGSNADAGGGSNACSGAIGGSRAGTSEAPPGANATPAAGAAIPQVTDVAAGEVEAATAGGSPLDAGKALAAQAEDERDASTNAEAPQGAAAAGSGSRSSARPDASTGGQCGDPAVKFAGVAALGGAGGSSTSDSTAPTAGNGTDASSGTIDGSRAGAPEVPPGDDASPAAGAASPQVTDVAAGEVAAAGDSPLDAGKALLARADDCRDEGPDEGGSQTSAGANSGVGAKSAGTTALGSDGGGSSDTASAAGDSSEAASSDASSHAIGGTRAGAPEVQPDDNAAPAAGAAIPQVTDVAAGEVEQATAGGSPLDAGKALAAQADDGRDASSEPQGAAAAPSSGSQTGGVTAKFAGIAALGGNGGSSLGADTTSAAAGSSDASSRAIGGSRAGAPGVPPGDDATPAVGMAVPQVTDVAAGEVEQATAGGSPLDAGKALAGNAAAERGDSSGGAANDAKGLADAASSSHAANAGGVGLAADSTAASAASGGSAAASSRSRAATPQPRLAPRRAWQVAIGEDGLMRGCERPAASREVAALVARVLDDGAPLDEAEITRLFRTRGADLEVVCRGADKLRRRVNGDAVSYTVNRNINYTNICTYKCQFCAFSKGKANENLRGAPYLLGLEEVARRTAEAWERGATEVCMQGGIHPDFTGETYLRLLQTAREAAPGIHVHAFSPLEVAQGAASSGWSLDTYLRKLKAAGLGSLPGTAAEVLDDGVRDTLCPDKLSTAQWLEVVGAAHRAGIRTSSTIMFGHVDGACAWARHLLALRSLQAATGGITEFVPLPFVHMQAPIYLKGRARRGPTLAECVLMHAVARLALHPLLTNVQASWVKMGPEQAARLLTVGCNDMGGSIMNESITRAAGAEHGQELPPERMETLIRDAGRAPWQRTTLYAPAHTRQTARSFGAAPLAQLAMR